MKFAYEDLSPGQFEHLTVLICQRLLGLSVKAFATGADGGRDAKFHGTAQLHPSTSAPWKGKVIIQAKHTNGYNRSFSEGDFYKKDTANTIIAKELPRIKALRAAGDLDHYMLFANRRLTGGTDAEITKFVSTEAGIPEESIYLCGLEVLETWMKQFQEVPKLANLDPVDSPLIVSSDELAIVVEAFAKHKEAVVAAFEAPPAKRTSYAEKNALNNMSAEYAAELRRRYLKETAQIDAFLSAPENDKILQSYEVTTEEFQMKIIAHQKEYQNFDSVMEYLLELLFDRDAVLRQTRHKKLTRAVLFYMYWKCDIGKNVDATA